MLNPSIIPVIKTKWIIVTCFLVALTFSFGQKPAAKFIDSADYYLYTNPKLSLEFLDNIDPPIKKTLKGYLTEYYGLRGFVYYELDNMPKTHQNLLLAIESAEIEKKYDKGGSYCVELHNIELNSDSKNREAILEKARYFYNKTNNSEGLLEVEQQAANRAFYNNEFEDCVNLNLAILDKTRQAKDQYMRLLTTYMLSSSYYNLLELEKGEQFFTELRSLRGKNGIEDKNYFYNIGSLYYDKAIYFYKKQELDSSELYFNKVQDYHSYSGSAFKKDYYKLGVDLFELAKKPVISSRYKDSIMLMQELENSFAKNESFNANRQVIGLDKDLKSASQAKIWYIVIIVLILMAIAWLVVRYRKKIKEDKSAKSKKAEEILHLKKEQQLMSVSIVNLEEYISELKSSLKNLSQSDEEDTQKVKLKELYNELNVVSSTLLNKESIQKMGSINQEFLSYIKTVFPDLTESEQEVCYYLYLGMKNKEIATHLNTTTRSIESSRYRLSKKMNLATKGVSVKDYIQKNLKERGLE